MCDFQYHYEQLQIRQGDPPMAKRVKKCAMPLVIQNWKEYASKSRTGMKGMTAEPLEDCVMEILKTELRNLNVEVEKRKKFEIWHEVSVVMDGLLRKPNKPTTLLSIKVWMWSGNYRETFGYGYFAKSWYGQKNIRLYVVALYLYELPEAMMHISKPWIDGLYYISQNPYIDILVNELKTLYK